MIKLFEMFAGYGGASFALKKAGIEHEVVGYSEIDKYAIQCYEQNHKGKNFGDCTKIDPNDIPDFDLLTGGFPCQSFSVAGKGLGEQDTRGTLFHEIIRIAEVKKPKYMLLENVKGLTTKRHKETFEKILSELKRIGYHVHWKVLNSKNFGVPQNRKRVWFVCFREDLGRDRFEFPEGEELKIFLKDVLEDEVDEKYYLKQDGVEKLLSSGFKDKLVSNTIRAGGRGSLDGKHTWDVVVVGNTNPSGRGMNGDVYAGDIAPTLTTNKGEGNKIIQLNKPNHSNNRVYSSDGISPTLTTMGGGNRQPFIVASRGRNPNNPSDRTTGATTEQRLEPRNDGCTNTLTSVQKDNYVAETICLNSKDKDNNQPKIQSRNRVYGSDDFRIRKLTPKECFRLMGFLNDEINLDGLSNTQRYKLAGNGWDINLVSRLFKAMFNSIVPHTNFPSEFSENGKRHNIDLEITQQVAPSKFEQSLNFSKTLIMFNLRGRLQSCEKQ